MRNFVVKNDFNRSSYHKDKRMITHGLGTWRKNFMMTEKTWEEILAKAQPMEVKKIVNNAPSLPKIKFYEEVEDNESKD